MRRALLFSAATAALLFVASGNEARADPSDWGFRIGFGGPGIRVDLGFGGHHHHHRHFRHHRHHRHVVEHVCVRTPVYDSVWVEPVYREVFVGHDHCGRPIFRSVLVRAGYHHQVFAGYRCSCGRRFH